MVNLERGVGHGERDKFLPVLGPVRRPQLQDASRGSFRVKRSEQAENCRPGGQVRTWASVRSAAPTVSFPLPKINDVMA